eukprot:TRINITY_DN55_c0_g1_i1.p2 TRINITY_DN55_c0_g1~~TRINITY_DN55_c0_g1_i1.p2  ORF type:complete len:512 (+),score=161.94 TRINITY_DN55_c0_g1_i1:10499-12034(+)
MFGEGAALRGARRGAAHRAARAWAMEREAAAARGARATSAAQPQRNHPNANANANANRIASLPDALSALKQHVLTPSLQRDALRASHQLLARTLEAVNGADVNALHAARAQLHPRAHLLAYASTLHAALAAVPARSPLVPHLLAEFVQLVRTTPRAAALHAAQRWIGASRHAARLVIERADVRAALALIRPLRLAADKLATSPDCIVPIHADFLAVCLHAKCYRLAARWLRERRRMRIDVLTGVLASDVHLLYHYAAVVFIGVKDYAAALHSCRLALAVPAPTPGAFFQVALSTFKYYMLLHLLVTGKAPQPFKFSSYQLSRLRNLSSEYADLAAAYERMDRAQTQRVFEANRHTFEKHGNLGVVKQLMSTLTDALIERLTNSFVTMKMEHVARRLGLADQQQLQHVIVRMIEQRKIYARIDDRKRVVRLEEEEEERAKLAHAMFTRVCGELMQQSVQVLQRVHEFREKLQSDPDYVSKTMGARSHRRAVGGSASSAKRSDAELLRLSGRA